jgi:hypothetical protein
MTHQVLEPKALSTLTQPLNIIPPKKRKIEVLTNTVSKKQKIESPARPTPNELQKQPICIVKTQRVHVTPNKMVDKIVDTVSQMSAWERKYLLCKMIEALKPHEFRHVKETYFSKGTTQHK